MACVLARISYMLSCESFLKEDLLLMMCPKIMDYYVMLNIFPSKLFAVVFLLLLSLRFVAYGTLYTVSNQSSKAETSQQLQNYQQVQK